MGPHSVLRLLLPALALIGFGLASCESAGPTSPERNSQIALSTTILSISEDLSEGEVKIINTQDVRIDWFVKSVSASWIEIVPHHGTLEAHASQILTVRVDRSELSVGTNSASIEFEGGGRAVLLAVTVEHAGETVSVLLDPDALSLGPNDASGVIEVVNSGSAPLDWSMTGPEWIQIDPASGVVTAGERSQVVVTPDRSDLSIGVHDGLLSLSSNGGNATATLSVEVAESSGLRLDPSTLDFGTSVEELSIRVVNDATQSIDWAAQAGTDWISLSPSTGTVPAGSSQSVTVDVSRSSLPSGTHQAAIRFTSNMGSAAATVIVKVPDADDSPPRLAASPTALDFGEAKTELSIRISNDGEQSLDWSARPSVGWLSLSESAGQLAAGGSKDLLIQASRSSLSSGDQRGTIEITSNGGDASIPVSLVVAPSEPPDSEPPDDDGPPTLSGID
ncbi:MAG: hypothetical protein KY432_06775, partial [Acidobacteria bacterium]|nr:hypothetical protein [Acidobacteriota bacterium]